VATSVAEGGGIKDSASLRLVDAEVAIVYSLRQGAYLASVEPATTTGAELASASNVPALRGTQAETPSSGPAIRGEALQELVAWLDFLSKVFPSRRASHNLGALAQIARKELEKRGFLDRGMWIRALGERVIDKVQPTAGEDPTSHFRLCQSYTCGLWTLFHLSLVSVAEIAHNGTILHRAAAVSKAVHVVKPAEALARIRGFVAHFFGCYDCVKHFLETYDSCQWGRCQLSPTDGYGTALWLWRVHNRVTRRVSQERNPNAPPAGPWPSRKECSNCWALADHGVESVAAVSDIVLEPDEERWDTDAVYKYLRQSFWRDEWLADVNTIALPTADIVLQVAAFLLACAGLFYIALLKLQGGRSKRGRTKKGC